MKRYVILVPALGDLRTRQDVVETAILTVGLKCEDFITIGLGTNTQLCVSAEVYSEKKNDVAIGMIKSHLTTIRQEK